MSHDSKEVITGPAIRRVLREYWYIYRTDPWNALSSLFFPAIGSIFIFFIPPLIVAEIINTFVAEGRISVGLVAPYLLAFGSLWLLGEILWRLGLHTLIKLETRGVNILGKKAFQELAERDYDFYTDHFVGSLTKKALAFSRRFEEFTDTLAFNLSTNVIPIIFALVVLWRYSPIIPLILLGAITLAVSIAIPIIRKRARLVALRHDAGSNMSGRMSDAITNILAIKSFAKEKEELENYGWYVNDYAQKMKKASDYQNQRFDMVMSPIYVTTNLIGLAAAIYFTGTLGIEVGAVVVVFTYFSQVTRVFWEINRIYRNIESSIGEAAEFTQMLIAPPAIQDKPDAMELKVSQAKISFKDAYFRYDSEESDQKMFLNGFDFNVESNQKIGLVGPSGGGKTTITKLLLRFVDLQDGQILIDGQDIRLVSQESLRKNIAYVPQEPLLFHRSLAENIAYGSSGATMPEIIEAAKLAHAHEFISNLPQGYETLVGERGVKLSGGQRQRVAIARAILKKAPILVLDEATSSLDSESEKYIQDGLKELMKDKTALVIAHRLSTIKNLDRIIVLANGEIVQDGTHKELIKKRGLYAKLWSHQSGEFLED